MFRLGVAQTLEQARRYWTLALSFPFTVVVRFRDARGRFCTPGPQAVVVEFYGR